MKLLSKIYRIKIMELYSLVMDVEIASHLSLLVLKYQTLMALIFQIL